MWLVGGLRANSEECNPRENPLEGVASWPRNFILQTGAFSSWLSSGKQEKWKNGGAREPAQGRRDGGGGASAPLVLRENSGATSLSPTETKKKEILLSLGHKWHIILFPRPSEHPSMLPLLPRTFPICGASVSISHCSQKRSSQTSLCCFCTTSVKLENKGESRRGNTFWVPFTPSHWHCQVKSQMRKRTRRCRAPRLELLRHWHAMEPLQVLFKCRNWFSRARADPGYHILNKLPASQAQLHAGEAPGVEASASCRQFCLGRLWRQGDAAGHVLTGPDCHTGSGVVLPWTIGSSGWPQG